MRGSRLESRFRTIRLATLSPSAPRCSSLGSARNSVAFSSSLLFSQFGSGSQLCRLRLLVALFSVRSVGSQLCRLRLLVALLSVWLRLATLSPSAPRCSFLGLAQASNSVAFGSSLLFSRFDQSDRNSVASGSSLLVFTKIERRLTETHTNGRTSNKTVEHNENNHETTHLNSTP